MEAVARDAISIALWDNERAQFDPSRLPPDADAAIAAFFSSRLAYSAGFDAGSAWFDLCSGRAHAPMAEQSAGHASPLRPLRYLSGGGSLGAYELHPSADNLVDTLRSILGHSLCPPSETSDLTPLWPGATVGWQIRNGGSDRPVIRVRGLCAPAAAPAGVAGSALPSGGADQRRGELRASRAATRNEELCVIFTEGVHVYSLRRMLGDEPRWLSGVRGAWLAAWREHGASHALGIRGEKGLALGCLLGASMLHASAHRAAAARTRGTQSRSSIEFESVVLAVLAAAPYGCARRAAAPPRRPLTVPAPVVAGSTVMRSARRPSRYSWAPEPRRPGCCRCCCSHHTPLADGTVSPSALAPICLLPRASLCTRPPRGCAPPPPRVRRCKPC